MSLVDRIQEAGVVGAGGGGFPTHVKLAGKADVVIANGAECEPLLHKDAAVMERQADRMIEGMRLAMEAVGASSGIVGIKAKNRGATLAVEKACRGQPVRVHALGDYYPAGDEYDLVHETTGRLIPAGGIPLQVGAVVCNVETLVNIAAAAAGEPVTRKTLTIAGAVRQPSTMTVPIGTSLRDCIAAAGGAAVPDPVLCIGGMMMGETTGELDRPVTKTTGGAIVLSRTHRVIERKLKPAGLQSAIGRSACDQCRYCTELCPRYLLGYAVEPHQVMRSLAFTASGADHWNSWAAMCCACGLCTLYACPEELFPKEACDRSKAEMKRAGIAWSGPSIPKPHPIRDGRRVPIQALMSRLGITEYDHPAPFGDARLTPARAEVLLKQGAGAASAPMVAAGDRVAEGQKIGAVPGGALGSAVHAPFAGTVAEATPVRIVIIRG